MGCNVGEAGLQLVGLSLHLTCLDFLGEIPTAAFLSRMTQSVTNWPETVQAKHGSYHHTGPSSAGEHVRPSSGASQLAQTDCWGLWSARKYLAERSLIFFEGQICNWLDSSKRFVRVKESSLSTFHGSEVGMRQLMGKWCLGMHCKHESPFFILSAEENVETKRTTHILRSHVERLCFVIYWSSLQRVEFQLMALTRLAAFLSYSTGTAFLCSPTMWRVYENPRYWFWQLHNTYYEPAPISYYINGKSFNPQNKYVSDVLSLPHFTNVWVSV